MAKPTPPLTTLPSRSLTHTLLGIFFIISAILATYEMRVKSTQSGLEEKMQSTVATASFSDYGNAPLRTRYTGIAGLDYGLQFLVAAFLPGAAGWEKGFQVQQAYFLVQFFSVIGTYSVEAGRRRGGWVKYTSIWALFYQTVGGAIIIPLYCLAYLRDANQKDYFAPSSQRIPVSYAKALLPALVIGYLIPTLAMFYPFKDANSHTTQGLVAVWQATPLYVNILLFIISKIASDSESPRSNGRTKKGGSEYLTSLYVLFITVSTLSHVFLLYYSLILYPDTAELTLSNIFLPRPLTKDSTIGAQIHRIFQVDFLIIFAASLAWAYAQVHDMKKVGLRNVSLSKAALIIGVTSVVAGPAAAIGGVWMWKDRVISRGEEEAKRR